CLSRVLFSFGDSATTGTYPLSLPDALPIWLCTFTGDTERTGGHAPMQRFGHCQPFGQRRCHRAVKGITCRDGIHCGDRKRFQPRSEEHTSELQSRENLVCRLLLEKKKKNKQ